MNGIKLGVKNTYQNYLKSYANVKRVFLNSFFLFFALFTRSFMRKGGINMITFLLLLSITLAVLFIGFILLSIGGSLFLILFGDLMVAIFVIWFLFFRKKKKSK